MDTPDTRHDAFIGSSDVEQEDPWTGSGLRGAHIPYSISILASAAFPNKPSQLKVLTPEFSHECVLVLRKVMNISGEAWGQQKNHNNSCTWRCFLLRSPTKKGAWQLLPPPKIATGSEAGGQPSGIPRHSLLHEQQCRSPASWHHSPRVANPPHPRAPPPPPRHAARICYISQCSHDRL